MSLAPTSTAALPLLVVDVEFGLLALLVLAVGIVSYTVYRDAAARGMDHAAYWGAAVGLLFVVGFVVGGLVAVGAYIAVRPDETEEPLIPDRTRTETTDASSAPERSEPELTVPRVRAASDTALRGYARRVDGVDPTTDPADVRAQLLAMIGTAGEGRRLAEACDCAPCTCNPCDCTGAADDDTADGDTDEANRDGTNDGAGGATSENSSDEAATDESASGVSISAWAETDASSESDSAGGAGGSDTADDVATAAADSRAGTEESESADTSREESADTSREESSGTDSTTDSSTETDTSAEAEAETSTAAEAETETETEAETETSTETDTQSSDDAAGGPDNFDGRGELHDGDPKMPADDPEDSADGDDEV